MIGVTIGSPDFEAYDYIGWDQMFRFFFRRPGQDSLRLPTWSNDGWMAQWFMMSAQTRPHVRLYTARAFRPDLHELDIEFVAHGDSSPASGWASRVKPGEPVGILDEGITYQPPSSEGWQLLVGDESALPAILAIIDRAPADLRARVFLEVPHAEDVREVPRPEGVSIHWLPREDNEAIPGQLALRTITTASLPATNPSYSYVAGESGLATGARRFLVNELGVPKADVTFQGYWRHGKASPG
ncbi:siderophore-interacting protein [Microbacterium schleiferi]|uniref:Siderophore-interacting protein n=2 Tax=Microbacterium schleiferi TaxID=69362 RepID=A0A7S8RIF5_9MICO|nr:siderophore-interacting protein [Microbacterium schleiferi]